MEPEIVFQPDPSVYDGRWVNNGWLQELAKPLTKLTWDNAMLISPALMQRLKLRTGNVVEVENHGRKVRGPALVMPGQADNTITLVDGLRTASAEAATAPIAATARSRCAPAMRPGSPAE